MTTEAQRHSNGGSLLRKIHRLLRGRPVLAPYAELAERPHRLVTAYWLVRAFYLFLFFDAYAMLRRTHSLILAGATPDPLWIISWIGGMDPVIAMKSLTFGFIVTAFLAVVWPRSRWPRIAAAAFALCVYALHNSFGSFNHGHYYPMWLALIFVLLPAGDLRSLQANRAQRESFLGVFFLSQCTIGLFYTLSGLYKLSMAPVLAADQISSLSPDALPYLIINRWLQTGENVFFETFFANNLWIAWPIFLAVIYIEIVALVIVFRPQLHAALGIVLAMFHVSIWLFMGIAFVYQPIVVLLLFAMSPFKPRSPQGMKQALVQLPIFGDAYQWFSGRRETRAELN